MNFSTIDEPSLLSLDDIIDRSVLVVAPEMEIGAAIALLKGKNEILIARDGRLLGIITAAGVLELLTAGIDKNTPLSGVMEREPPTINIVKSSLNYSDLVQICKENLTPRAVLDGEGNILGFLTSGGIGEIVKVLVSESQSRLAIEIEARKTDISYYARRLTLALEGANVGLWDWDISTDRVYWTTQHEVLFGYSPGTPERTYGEWKTRVHPDDIERVEKELTKAIDNGSDYRCQYRVLWPDGQIRWLEGLGRFFYEDARPLRGMGIIYDVTDRKIAEASLQESEARFRQIAETIEDVFWIIDASRENDYRIDYISPAYEKLWGFDRRKLYGNFSAWLETIHPDDRYIIQNTIHEYLQGKGAEIEYRIIRPDGEVRWIRDRGFTVRDENGKPIRFIGVARDETDSKNIEAILDLSQARLKTLFDANVIGLLIGDIHGRIKEANDELLRIIGYSRDDLENDRISWVKITPPEYLPLDRERVNEAIERGACTPYEKEYIRSDGTRVPILVGYGLVGEEREESVAFILDLSEIKNAQKQLQERNELIDERNRELDRFAYVVSHDLKAPLRAIANLSEWIEEDLEGKLDGETKKNMNLLRQRVYRLNSLIDGLLAYSRVGRTEVEETRVDVTKLIEEIIDFLGPPPEFSINIVSELPILYTKKILLTQVLANLIGNAIKHHPGNDGKLEIGAIDRDSYYEFIVRDNGAGIAPEFHEKIFVMFQVLQPRDRVENTGIGLAIVKKIVDTEGGRIWLESSEGEGSTFHFTWLKTPRPGRFTCQNG